MSQRKNTMNCKKGSMYYYVNMGLQKLINQIINRLNCCTLINKLLSLL